MVRYGLYSLSLLIESGAPRPRPVPLPVELGWNEGEVGLRLVLRVWMVCIAEDPLEIVSSSS